ncbi:MAG TPA: DUF4153 domain-containing protein [Ferruginibacter sp.]|nr:DUF4153 domain-containing protein [Ferruginibacter sp.]
MKKNDWLLAISVTLYTFLFYQQQAGINFLIFTITLVAAVYIRSNSLIRNGSWLLAATGSLCSAVFVAFYGNELSVIANIISLSLLSAISLNDRSSVIVSLIFSFYSYCSTPIFIFIDRMERKQNSTPSTNGWSRKAFLIIIPVIITLFFFFIYQQSNPLFKELAGKINFDFVSWDWIFFAFGGFLLLYGFFYHKKIRSIAIIDENVSNDLPVNKKETAIILGKQINISEENFSGIVLFSLLNILLLVVNALDINFLFGNGHLPAGVTYSQFVHQGIGAIIVSVITAIAIILFYFRGSLNFYEKNKGIKLLAYCWIIQNAFMLIATMCKNMTYIHEYGLTYKRIGVYVYLFLTILGLGTTFFKILKLKSNNFLFRINGWLFYGVLVMSCFINWDAIITRFNIHKSHFVERSYLLTLSTTNLPTLFALENHINNKIGAIVLDDDKDSLNDESYGETSNTDFEEQLNRNSFYFLQTYDHADWRSWTLDDARVFARLQKANIFEKMITLNISNIKCDTKLLQYFPSLTDLDLRGCGISNIDFLQIHTNLQTLNLTNNSITDYSSLYALKNLKTLQIDDIGAQELALLQEHLPQTKINQ